MGCRAQRGGRDRRLMGRWPPRVRSFWVLGVGFPGTEDGAALDGPTVPRETGSPWVCLCCSRNAGGLLLLIKMDEPRGWGFTSIRVQLTFPGPCCCGHHGVRRRGKGTTATHRLWCPGQMLPGLQGQSSERLWTWRRRHRAGPPHCDPRPVSRAQSLNLLSDAPKRLPLPVPAAC